MMSLSLDRMALDDVGTNPQRIAEAILEQMRYGIGRVPVQQIALALDIIEIRQEKLTNFEGALFTQPERDCGSILVNARSGPRRRRYTIGHELYHFLNSMHRPITQAGFQCTAKDLRTAPSKNKDRHLRQEAEANTFAIELLAPRQRIKGFTLHEADLGHVLDIANEFDISKEAAARRYIALHDEILAVIFSKDSKVLYSDRGKNFPWLCLNKNDEMPVLMPHLQNSKLSEFDEVEPSDWIAKSQGAVLSAQTLYQQDGYAMTLLKLDETDEDDDPGIDDAFKRYSQFSHRDRD